MTTRVSFGVMVRALPRDPPIAWNAAVAFQHRARFLRRDRTGLAADHAVAGDAAVALDDSARLFRRYGARFALDHPIAWNAAIAFENGAGLLRRDLASLASYEPIDLDDCAVGWGITPGSNSAAPDKAAAVGNAANIATRRIVRVTFI